ncbi:hypothetical protein SYJ56_25145, partial [Algoriphagus sp. D3-2-R+10]|uniref:hypothetical protein n=1 Tax=Algoriphagus aurantiacus TaxID=3103948 RepID=UPI002B3B9BF9
MQQEKCIFDLIIPYGIHANTWSPINVSKSPTLPVGDFHFYQNAGRDKITIRCLGFHAALKS